MESTPDPIKLTPRMRKVLEWCYGGPRTETQIATSGLYSVATQLRGRGLLDVIDDPTVKEHGFPVRSFLTTHAGKAALAQTTKKETTK